MHPAYHSTSLYTLDSTNISSLNRIWDALEIAVLWNLSEIVRESQRSLFQRYLQLHRRLTTHKTAIWIQSIVSVPHISLTVEEIDPHLSLDRTITVLHDPLTSSTLSPMLAKFTLFFRSSTAAEIENNIAHPHTWTHETLYLTQFSWLRMKIGTTIA